LGGELPPELKAGIILFYIVLEERQRRLYAGLEAPAKSPEFLGGEVERQRIRQEGVGASGREKNTRRRPFHAGSEMAAPRHPQNRSPTAALKIQVSASTVRRLLRQLGFSLRETQAAGKWGNKNPPPGRVNNRQFPCIHGRPQRVTRKAAPSSA
jgi:hypothetical protein